MTLRLHEILAPFFHRTLCAGAALGVAVAAALACGGAAWAQAQSQPAASGHRLPSFAELEAAGAVIGQIRVDTRQIFDPGDPKEDHWLFRAANALHIKTRPGVIEHALLFKSGERVSARLIEETERLLRSYEYLYDVVLRPAAVHDGVVDIEVVTRDTWSLNLGVVASRAGGANRSGLSLKEYNLLGTGTALTYAKTNDIDRTTDEFSLANSHLFGSRAELALGHSANSDGSGDNISLVRPFYELDARWAAGLSWSRFDRLDPVYNAGEVASQYRHRGSLAEVFGGRSQGLIDGWTQRWSLGVNLQDDAYAFEPGVTAPARLPTDQKRVGPFLRYQVIEERYDRQQNRNLIGRPEFFALGLASTLQLGLASTALGSSRNALLYTGSVSRGFKSVDDQTVMASATLSGQFTDARVQQQQLGGKIEYYRPQSRRWLFYGMASGDLLTRPDANQTLMLGGDNGLHGYPLRYQSGTRRMLFTAEQRYYTDLFVWQLFHVGGAGFVDVGRAWGGDNVNTANPGWLADVGFGLRIVSARSAFGNVLHVDVAFPLNRTPDIQRVQFEVTTQTSF
ncbi:MAG: hypothetical protein JNL87_07455 [Burkholderiaceae bacterium]|nr:hypothetical protein [Burkholderiaceae bacterium]